MRAERHEKRGRIEKENAACDFGENEAPIDQCEFSREHRAGRQARDQRAVAREQQNAANCAPQQQENKRFLDELKDDRKASSPAPTNTDNPRPR